MTFRTQPWPAKWPVWLYPRGSDLLPFSDAQIGSRLANSRGRFADLEPEERARRLSEIGRKAANAWVATTTAEQRLELARRGGAARVAGLTPEQRSEEMRRLAKIGNAKRSTAQKRAAGKRLSRQFMATTTPEQRSAWARKASQVANEKRWGVKKDG